MIVAVEGPSAAGKTTWCRATGGQFVAEYIPTGQEPDGSDPAEQATYWAQVNAQRWTQALTLEGTTGVAVCDSDPLKRITAGAWQQWVRNRSRDSSTNSPLSATVRHQPGHRRIPGRTATRRRPAAVERVAYTTDSGARRGGSVDRRVRRHRTLHRLGSSRRETPGVDSPGTSRGATLKPVRGGGSTSCADLVRLADTHHERWNKAYALWVSGIVYHHLGARSSRSK